MTYDTLTNQDKNNAIASAIISREQEVFGYQFNINNYTSMLLMLPTTDWPENLVVYKDTKVELLPQAMTDADMQMVVDLQYRDRLRQLLRTEKLEQGKSLRVKAALEAQITVAEFAVAKALLQVLP